MRATSQRIITWDISYLEKYLFVSCVFLGLFLNSTVVGYWVTYTSRVPLLSPPFMNLRNSTLMAPLFDQEEPSYACFACFSRRCSERLHSFLATTFFGRTFWIRPSMFLFKILQSLILWPLTLQRKQFRLCPICLSLFFGVGVLVKDCFSISDKTIDKSLFRGVKQSRISLWGLFLSFGILDLFLAFCFYFCAGARRFASMSAFSKYKYLLTLMERSFRCLGVFDKVVIFGFLHALFSKLRLL